MVYEFIFFEEHFHSLISRTSFPKSFFSESKKALEREQIRLVRIFRDIAVIGKKQKKVNSYFNFHQKNLVILMDKVHSKIQDIGSVSLNNTQQLTALELLLESMSLFLEWLEKIFPKHFNSNEKVPIQLLLPAIAKLEIKLQVLLSELKNRLFSENFLEMIKKVLDHSYVTNFRDITYYNAVLDITVRTIIEHNLQREDEGIMILTQNGINHSEFYRYAKEFISKEVESKPTLDDQISTICGFRKEIRLLYVEKRNKQFPEFPNIKKVLNKYIKEELLLLRAMEFVNHGLAESGIMNANYKVSFSVKQLAFFVHLQMETGIIIWQRAKFAHQYIARHFSTVERDSISEKSVRNAHYNHASEDIKKVIAKLGEMLAIAQEKY